MEQQNLRDQNRLHSLPLLVDYDVIIVIYLSSIYEALPSPSNIPVCIGYYWSLHSKTLVEAKSF